MKGKQTSRFILALVLQDNTKLKCIVSLYLQKQSFTFESVEVPHFYFQCMDILFCSGHDDKVKPCVSLINSVCVNSFGLGLKVTDVDSSIRNLI